MDVSPSTDSDLLACWVRHRDEAAFQALVGRYTHLVHMAARRISGDESMAADASQLVFVLLARKAGALIHHPSLAAWLHVTTVRTTRDLIDKNRREARKIERFQETMDPQTRPPDEAWRDLQPALDIALAALSTQDREALLLRFDRALSVKEVAATLGIATATAQKRIDRATERLRTKLLRRGCHAGGSLAVVLSAGFAADSQAAVPAASVLAGKAIASGAAGGSMMTGALTSAMMKTTSVLVPAAVLVAGGVWLAMQFHTMAGLEDATARMTRRIAATDANPAMIEEQTVIPTAIDRKPVDWVEVARQLKQSNRYDALNPHARLEAGLDAMSLGEVDAALGEIAAAPLTDDDRKLLHERFCGVISRFKNGPELVLERFVPLIETGLKWTLGGYFARWMEQDSDQALVWLGKNADQIKDLSFGFLDVSFYPLLAKSPATAGRLLEALPPERRLDAMRSLSIPEMSPEQHIAWAAVVRKHIPADQRLQAVAWPTMLWSDGDGAPMTLVQVAAYLQRIEATKEEREVCIIAAARERAGVDENTPRYRIKLPVWIEGLRQWVASLEPGLVDRATGEALAGDPEGSISEEVVDLALQYHAESGNDALLLPFFNLKLASETAPLVRKLAVHLTDDQLRQTYLAKYNQAQP